MASNPDVKSKQPAPFPTLDNLVRGLYQQRVPLKCAHEPASGVQDPGDETGTLTVVVKVSQVISIRGSFDRG